jgi:dTDP-glucose 4,6-dehydratase/UDP-glucuronate decarboxylase
MPAEPTLTAAAASEAAEAVVRHDVEEILDAAADAFERLAGRNVLLTGGAGFLGYELTRSILGWNDAAADGRRISLTVADNYARGVPDWLAGIGDRSDLRLMTQDVTRPWPDDTPPLDYVIHAAGIASPTYYRRYPVETMDANIVGLRLLLDRCLAQGDAGQPISGFLFFSSSEIYGDPPASEIPTRETYRGNVSCTGPRACYDESKRFGETLCTVYARHHGLPVTSARPFNNYGPGLKISDRRVIPDFARDVLAGRDIVLHSDGSPTRTFCYVADAAAGYLRVLTLGSPGEAYNIGIEAPEVSMRELAERVAAMAGDLTGSDPGVVFEASGEAEYLTDNPDRRCPDITKARTELGYDPRVGLDDGLRRSLRWYLGNPTAADA